MAKPLIKDPIETELNVRNFLERVKGYYADKLETANAPLWMAGLAAFPIAIDINLLYQLWANFQQLKDLKGQTHELPVLVVNDIALSPLLEPTSRDTFEMSSDTRAWLLQNLKAKFGQSLIEELASFLYKYVQQNRKTGTASNYYDAQEWTAILAVDPEGAAAKILGSLKEHLDKNNLLQSIGVANLINTLSKDNNELAGIMSRALETKEASEPSVSPENPVRTSGSAGNKTIVVRPDSTGNGIKVPLSASISRALKPIYEARQQIISASKKKPGTTHLISIAIDDYQYYPELGKSVADAEKFIGLFESLNDPNRSVIHRMHNKQATSLNVFGLCRDIRERTTDDDTIIFYFCGHAENKNGGKLILYDTPETETDRTRLLHMPAGLLFAQGELDLHMGDPSIVLILDCSYAGTPEWIGKNNARDVMLTASQFEEEAEEEPSLTDFLVQFVNTYKGVCSYRQLYKYLLDALTDQTPMLSLRPDSWNNQVFTQLPISPEVEIKSLLEEPGMPSMPLPEAEAQFRKKFNIPGDESILQPLRYANKFKDTSFLKIVYLLDQPSPRESQQIATMIEGIASFEGFSGRAGIRLVDITRKETSRKISTIRAFKNYDIVIIGLNRSWVENKQAIEDLKIAMPVAEGLDTVVYYMIEEPCNLDALPESGHGYLNTFQSSDQPIEQTVERINSIINNLEKYLLPPSDNQLQIDLLIREAANTGELDLSNSDIHEFPAAILELRGIRALRLSGNQIRRIPSEIARLTSLTQLEIANNPLTDLPDEIVDLINLERLDISETQIALLPSKLDNLSLLRSLKIDYTQIRVLDIGLINALHLEYFSCAGNNFINSTPTGDLSNSLDDFRQGRANNTSIVILEIHSEFAFPRFEKSIPQGLGGEVEYKFHRQVETLPDLFKILWNEAGSQHTLVYLCDEKNILSPQFGEGLERHLLVYQYFWVLKNPIGLIINNPFLQSGALQDLSGPGLLSFDAVRDDTLIEGPSFAERFFDAIWEEKRYAIKPKVFISSTYRGMESSRRELIDFLTKSGYQPIALEFGLPTTPPPLNSIRQDIESADLFILLLGGQLGSQVPGQNQTYIQVEYAMALARNIPIRVFIDDTLSDSDYATKYFTEKSNNNPNVVIYFFSYPEGLIHSVNQALILMPPHRRTRSISETLKALKEEEERKHMGYLVHVNDEKMSNFSLPLPASVAEKIPKAEELTETTDTNTRPFRDKWVLVYGAREELTEEQLLACQLIGSTLAAEGYGLLTRAWGGVNRETLWHFINHHDRYKDSWHNSVRQLLMPNEKALVDDTGIEPLASEKDWFEHESFYQVFALILIGESDGLQDALRAAQRWKVPVIPIPRTGDTTDGIIRNILSSGTGSHFSPMATLLAGQRIENFQISSIPNALPAVLEGIEDYSTELDFRQHVELIYGNRNISIPEDLQKNRWGGKSTLNGKTLFASIRGTKNRNLFNITINLRADPKANLFGEVAFFLHHTLQPEIRYEPVVKRVAQITLEASEAFTVGAYTEDGTLLELDLSQLTGNPGGFYPRQTNKTFTRQAETLDRDQPVTYYEDPQKDRWGRRSVNGGKQIAATTTLSEYPDRFNIDIRVTSETDRPLAGELAFYLYDRRIVFRKVVDGIGRLSLTTHRGFSLGVYTSDGARLELEIRPPEGFVPIQETPTPPVNS